MLSVLLLLVALLALFSFFHFKKDPLSPSFIISCVFLIGTLFAVLGNNEWGVQISFNCVFIIFFGLLMIFFGELSFKSLAKQTKTRLTQNCSSSFSYNKRVYFLLVVVQIIISVLYFYRVVSLASTLGEIVDFGSLVRKVRVATINNGLKIGTFFSIFGNISSAVPFWGLFILFKTYDEGSFLKHLFKNKLIVLSNVIYLFDQLISGARNGFILFCVVLLASMIICWREKKRKMPVRRLLGIGFLVFVLFSVIFSIVGVQMGKMSTSNILDEIIRYGGGSIPGLSVWLETGETSQYFGQETFWGLRHLIHMAFPYVYDGSEFYNGVEFSNGSGINIFTGFRAFYADFSYFGVIVIPFLIGFFYTMSIEKIKINYNPLSVVVYSYMLYFFVNLLFAPSVTSNLFTSSQVSTLFWLVVVGQVLIKRSSQRTTQISRLRTIDGQI